MFFRAVLDSPQDKNLFPFDLCYSHYLNFTRVTGHNRAAYGAGKAADPVVSLAEDVPGIFKRNAEIMLGACVAGNKEIIRHDALTDFFLP